MISNLLTLSVLLNSVIFTEELVGTALILFNLGLILKIVAELCIIYFVVFYKNASGGNNLRNDFLRS